MRPEAHQKYDIWGNKVPEPAPEADPAAMTADIIKKLYGEDFKNKSV